MTVFLNDRAHAQGRSQEFCQRLRLRNSDDTVTAFALLGLVSAAEVNEMRRSRSLLAEFESTNIDIEVGIALPDNTVVFSFQCETGSECAFTLVVDSFEFDITRASVDGSHGAILRMRTRPVSGNDYGSDEALCFMHC
jgi:hypothetical protein